MSDRNQPADRMVDAKSRKGLHPNDPELTSLTESAGEHARSVAEFAAARALEETQLAEPPVAEVLQCLGVGDRAAAFAQRESLRALVDRLDDEYLDAADADSASEESLRLFSLARAANALLVALDADAVQAAREAIYEAYYALPDDRADTFLAEVKEKLRRRGSRR